MAVSPIVGLSADLLTFSGGYILALDAVRQAKQFTKIRRTAKALGSPQLVRLKVEFANKAIDNLPEDIEYAFLRRNAIRAAVGTSLLAGGFLLSLAARGIELFCGAK